MLKRERLYRQTVYKTGDAGMCVCHHRSIHLSTITYLENSRLPWGGIVMRESFLPGLQYLRFLQVNKSKISRKCRLGQS